MTDKRLLAFLSTFRDKKDVLLLDLSIFSPSLSFSREKRVTQSFFSFSRKKVMKVTYFPPLQLGRFSSVTRTPAHCQLLLLAQLVLVCASNHRVKRTEKDREKKKMLKNNIVLLRCFCNEKGKNNNKASTDAHLSWSRKCGQGL